MPTPSVAETRSSSAPRGGDEAREAAVRVEDAGRAGRGDGVAQAPDDRLGRLERDARGGVGVLRHATSTTSNRPLPPDSRDSGIGVG